MVQPASSDIHPRMTLYLSYTQDEWHKANMFFSEQIVPPVCRADSVAEKNRALTEGVYDYFATTFGTKPFRWSKWRKQKAGAERKLASITKCKNKVRSQLQMAKQEWSTPAIIPHLAKSFFQLVQDHIKGGQLRTARKSASKRLLKASATITSTSLLRASLITQISAELRQSSTPGLLLLHHH